MRHSIFNLVIVVLFLTSTAFAEKHRLFILHTNDIHGHIEATDKGGLTRVAALIQLFRELFPGQVVLLDAGDTSLGTALSGTYFGKPTAEVMAYLNYDAISLGNHEFTWGKTKMRALTDTLDAPVLCANLVSADGSPPPYPSHTVVTRNGVKLAIVGLVAPDTYRRVHPEATQGWEFLPPETAVRTVMPSLPRDYDALICLNHIGVDKDRLLARAVPEIDLIVGGHSHTPLHEVVLEDDTPIVQAGVYAQYLGILEVLVDTDTNSLEVVNYKLKRFDGSDPQDPAAQEIVEKYAAELRPILAKVVTQVEQPITQKPAEDGYDTALGNFISDVFRSEAGTDIALYNRGGVRFDMDAGPLTVEDTFKLFPFDDPVVVVQVSGSQLREIIEQGTVDGEGPLSSSGLTANIENGSVKDILVDGEPIESERLYTLATTKFLASGGDGMASLANFKVLRSLPFTRNVLLNYLESHPRISPPQVGRLAPR